MTYLRYFKLVSVYPLIFSGIMALLLGSISVGLTLFLLGGIAMMLFAKEIREVLDLADEDQEDELTPSIESTKID